MESCQGCKYFDVKHPEGWESKYCDYYHVQVIHPIGCCNYKAEVEAGGVEDA